MTDYGRRLDFDNYCGKQVGRGYLTFPCRLDKGHPADEPCVAPEIYHSVRLHNVWEEEQRLHNVWEAVQKAQDLPQSSPPEADRVSPTENETGPDESGQDDVEALLMRARFALTELEDVADSLRKVLDASADD